MMSVRSKETFYTHLLTPYKKQSVNAPFRLSVIWFFKVLNWDLSKPSASICFLVPFGTSTRGCP